MKVQQIVQKLEEEIKGKNRKDTISGFEKLLSENIEEISQNDFFFNLPLKNIFSIFSKIDFNLLEENDRTIDILQNIIKNIINKHFEEKETILILQNLNLTTNSFSYEEIFSILELITNCPILVNFCNLYKEQNKEVDIDYEYELQQKENEIEKLKKEIYLEKQFENEFLPITEKPIDFEPDIFKACREGKLTSVQWLLEKENEDKNKKDKYDNTPIHIATENCHLEIVEYLIKKQNVDKDIKGNFELTPLHCACENGYLKIVKYLILKGANIEAKDNIGETPLHYACECGHLPVVEYLISKGANIEAKDKSFINTPLHRACKNGYLPVVEYLISKGANIEEKNSCETTPLHCACEEGYLPIVEFLISKGANIEAKNKDHWTPLDLASWYGSTVIIDYLISKGANTNIKDKDG